MNQEFASLVQEVFEVQHYPENADDNPYDAAGWTLPFQMGVNVIEASTPLSADFKAALKPVPPGKAVDWHTAARCTAHDERRRQPASSRAPADSPAPAIKCLLDPAQNNSFKLSRARSPRAARSTLPISRRTRVDTCCPAWRRRRSMRGRRSSGSRASARLAPGTRSCPARRRASVSRNEGMNWTQWLFDTFGIKYTVVNPTDLAAGNLASKFDVLVLPNGIGGGRGGGGGGGGGGEDEAVAEAAAAAPRVEPTDAVHAVDEFVRGGGTVLSWGNGATGIAQALQLPVQSTTAGLSRQRLLHRHVDHADPGRPVTSRDGRHAGAR